MNATDQTGRQGEDDDTSARRPACFSTPLSSTCDRGCFSVADLINSRKDNLNGSLTEKEKKLILVLREIDYGEVKVSVQDKQPLQILEVTRSIKI